MSVAELLPEIQVLTRAERLRLVRDIVTSLIVEEDEFSVKPSGMLFEVAGIAQSSVDTHTRDHAEDKYLERHSDEQ